VSYPFIRGAWSWEGEQDEGYAREYKLTYLIESLPTQGPASVLQTPGLPIPGTIWSLGDDLDIWAWVRPNARVTPLCTGEPNRFWKMELTASTKPLKRCSELKVEDPLLEPPDIDVDTVRDTDVSGYDRFGKRVTNSAHEQFPGKETEFDRGRDQIKIGVNLPTYAHVQQYQLYRDHVNKDWLWNYPPRCVKLSDVKAPRKMYGLCYTYWRLEATFDTKLQTFDRDLQDEGTKVLNGHWTSDAGATGTGGQPVWLNDDINGDAPDPENPAHFIKATDRQGNPCHMVLNGKGNPATLLGYKITDITAASGTTTQFTVNTNGASLPVGGKINVVGVHPLAYYNDEYTILTQTAALGGLVQFTAADPIDHPGVQGLFDSQTGAYIGDGFAYLKGAGAGNIRVESYDEIDFLQLYGVPAVIQ
jgi:hypothetical protein